MTYNDIFNKKTIIGMVHLLPLPDSPGFDNDISKIEQRALLDAKALENGGADALIVENFEDTPYEETISIYAYSVMLSIVNKIKALVKIPVGINIQFNDVEKEWSLAYASNASFLRAETFVESRYGIHGLSKPSAPKFMRLKNKYPSECIIFADVNVKHTYGATDMKLEDAAKQAIESGASAIIITGKETGCNPKIEELIELRKSVKDFPILVGSGINNDNIKDFLEYADGVIVGSSIKKNNDVHQCIDEQAVKLIVSKAK
ncbi:MAG: BtpA/SgcQ family protein [Firmicutes bacterium]|nr:BtpA/SgcQ family protein [Candidatus Colivicinus equi]